MNERTGRSRLLWLAAALTIATAVLEWDRGGGAVVRSLSLAGAFGVLAWTGGRPGRAASTAIAILLALSLALSAYSWLT
jgi:hypothetical protein